ncbi:phage tail protein [Corallococcus sicarius]|uniref:Phage tail protein n=1 Tax=Corallococcus sicarius TaxID=2316726 RepID=A0A3A8N0A1_9BACT|nr:phage tail protein [Corallococcus sicarius]RKH37897.1 phage tail protein [Corallococcus sicarius]
MPRFVESTKRDPYRNFNFRVLLNNVEVAACRKISGLTGTVEVVKFRSGNSLSSVDELSPGRAHYEALTLEAGLTQDTAFQDWATQLIRHEATPGLRAAEPDYRRTVEILVYDIDHNRPVKRFILHNAWCSKFTAMSELAAEANEILIESVVIEHEGFTIEAVV